MQIVTDLHRFKASPDRPLVLAIGNFDGFHRGHQKLLAHVVRQARRQNARAAVLTFHQHPHSILHPDQKPLMLTSIEQKLFFLAQAGVAVCFLPSFTPALAAMAPEVFVERVLVRRLHVREVCMGYDAHFGRGREGDTDMMARLAKKNGFCFWKMEPVLSGQEPVSSSRIRALLMKGEIRKAQECLGRPYSMFGKVIHGKGHGSHLGSPTANLEVHSEIVLPLGVYVASGRVLPKRAIAPKAGKFELPRKMPPWLPGIMNFGKRPTYPAFETPRPVLELHLLDFHEKIYGEMMEIALHRFMRPEKKFDDEEALKRQIRRDIRAARKDYSGGVF